MHKEKTPAGRREFFSLCTSCFFLLRILTLLSRLLAADGAFANFIFQHRVIGGTGPSKFIPGHYMPEIDQNERDSENYEDDAKGI
jgi:hypothetical protein